METLATPLRPTTGKLLAPSVLCREFGARASLTRDAVQAFHDVLVSSQQPALARWKTFFGQRAGRALDRTLCELAKLAARYGIAPQAAAPEAPLLALQTYYALLVTLVARRFGRGRIDELLSGSPFSWYASAQSERIDRLVAQLTDAIGAYQVRESALPGDDDCDLFKTLYQDLFPRSLRHRLGEYYTPDWLARHVLDQVGYDGDPGKRLLDPACGSGTFLVMALRRWRRAKRGEGNELSASLPAQVPGLNDGRISTCWGGSCTAAPLRETRDGSTTAIPTWRVLKQLLNDGRISACPLFPIVGFDLNPLAVLTARANYLLAVADLLPEQGRVEIPVYLGDSILGVPAPARAEAPFDFVVGNPPWIAWDNLPEAERQATKPLWERYGLFSLSGNEARHGGGKKDLSMLMLYAAADRYLKSGGRLGMVITQTLFQTKGAGDGFRRFRLGPDGEPLKVLRVDDLVALRPFGDAANWTSTIVLEKGAATEYPVPYFKWDERLAPFIENQESNLVENSRELTAPGRGTANPRTFRELLAPGYCAGLDAADGGESSLHPSSFLLHPFTARPIDPARPSSPWLVLPKQPSALPSIGRSDYTAHLGANSGGANGVYWVEVLDQDPEGGVLIRNVAARGKHSIETIEQVIEPELLCPLLRWSDVRRFGAAPRGYILLAQAPDRRTGIEEDLMRRRYPRTLAYLQRFEELLAARAAYRRYQQRGPFYSMYNVGPYTVAPIKVVWRRMDRQINAAVVEEIEDRRLGRRPVIPQETCVLVACDSLDEAHYLCAVLNSAAVNAVVAGHSVRGGKGFGTPGMLEFIPLRRFQYDDRRHAELAALSRQAHAALLTSSLGGRGVEDAQRAVAAVAEIQHQIDGLTAKLWAASI